MFIDYDIMEGVLVVLKVVCDFGMRFILGVEISVKFVLMYFFCYFFLILDVYVFCICKFLYVVVIYLRL